MELTAKQLQALSSPATEIFFGGAAGGGKSFLLRAAALLFARYCPGINIYLFRRTFEDLKLNHLMGGQSLEAMAYELFPNKYKFNKQAMTLSLSNGSVVALRHCQHEQDVFNYRGPDFHILLIDELTHFTETMYRFLRSRVRLGGWAPPPAYRKRLPLVITASNPSGIGHNFVRATFVDNGPAIKQMPAEEGGFLRQFIQSLLTDNPHIEKEYEGRLRGLGNAYLVDAMLHGVWDSVESGALAGYWHEPVHVIKPFRIPPGWEVSRSFDWGSSRPYSLGWWAVTDGSPTTCPQTKRIRTFPRGTMIRISEMYGKKVGGKPNEGARHTAQKIATLAKDRERLIRQTILNGQSIDPGAADNAIWDGSQGDKSIAGRMSEVGIDFVKSYKAQGSRIQGLLEFQARLENSKPQIQDPNDPKSTVPLEKPGLFVFNTCKDFIRTVPVLSVNPAKPDDVDSTQEDHCYDEARYEVMNVGSRVGYQRFM